jgi:D-sedoheptulose 7-phosphate isomerase
MEKFIKSFFEELGQSFEKTAWQDIAAAAKVLHATYEHGGRIYLVGNGGSAAIASHFASDLNKTVFGYKGDKKVKRFQAVALPDNTPVLTAWANDVGFEHVFAEQLKNFIQQKDILFAISSSGNSPNIIRAVEVAKANQASVIGLVGFRGGALKQAADVAIHIPVDDYAVVESAHQAVIHLLTKYFYEVIKEEKVIKKQEIVGDQEEISEETVNLLLALMRNVGQQLLRWREEESGFVHEYKPMSKEVVSELDRKAEQLIKDGLKEILPGYGFLGEEFGAEGDQKNNLVMIDPIDGTKNYLAGWPLFATQIAGLNNGQISWGIIYLPVLDEMFYAIRGKGAYLNEHAIKVSDQKDLGLALQCFGLGHNAETIIELPGIIKEQLAEPRSLGSAGVHMAFTACGRLDVYIAKEAGHYDIAPGIILCEEAGGFVHKFGRGGKNIIAGNSKLVEETKKFLPHD